MYHIIEKMQYTNFGTFIRNKRKRTGMSLNGFAIKNDIEPAILCRIEKQQQDVKLGVLIKIAEGFGQNPSALLKEFEETQKLSKRSITKS